MKTKNNYLFIATLLAMIFTFAACTPEDLLDIFDDDDDKTEYTLSISPNGTVTFPAEGGSVEFKVTTNAGYYGRSINNADWITAEFDKSKSYNCIVITAEANTTNQERSTVVTFYAQVEQDGKHVKEEKVTLVQPAATSGELPSMTLRGTLDFGTSINTTGYTVLTILDAQNVDGNSFSAKTIPSSALPQPLLVCDASGDVVMMSREPYAEGDQAKVDARSTALAVATMFPLFAPVSGSYEFKSMKTMLLGAQKWNAFEGEVGKLIRAKKPIWDEHNTGMVNALNDLFDEVCVEKSVYPLTRAEQPTQVSGATNERPFKMEISGHKVHFYNYALTPMYEGKLYHVLDMDDPVGSLNIPSGASYGLTDIFFRWGEFKWTKAATFDFDTLPSSAGEGQFLFSFSRMTTTAKVDFMVNFFGDMLDIVGAGYGTIGTATLKRAIEKWLVQRGMALTQLVMSGKWTKLELAEAVYAAILDFLGSKEFVEVCGIAASSSALAVVKKLSPVTTIYCLVRGSANTLMRTHYCLNAPQQVDIDLCYQVAFPLNACNWVTLEIVSGNNQQGLSNEYLKDPVRIRVNTQGVENASTSYYLRFSVLDGSGGEPMDEQEFTIDLEAKTYWKLGDKMREQHMIVEALDFATGQVVSAQPLELTAVATDIDETTKASIPEVLQGKWVQKEGTYTGDPIELDIHKYKASFHDPNNSHLDFTSKDVWYKPEVFFDGGMYNMVYFDVKDSSTGQYKIFLKGTSVSGSTLYVTDMYGPTGYCELVTENGGAYAYVSPSEMTFSADGGTQEAKITQVGYKKFGIVIDNKYKDWLSAKAVSGGKIQVTAQPNSTAEPRTGEVKWWVSASENPTEAQREYQTPIEVTQQGAANDIIVTKINGSSYAMKVVIKLKEQIQGVGGEVNIERELALKNGEVSFSQSGSTLHLSGSQSSSSDTQHFSCDIVNFTQSCSAAKATNVHYSRSYSRSNSSGEIAVSFADIPVAGHSVGSTNGHLSFQGSGANLVTSFSKSLIDSYGEEHVYNLLKKSENSLEFDFYFERKAAGQSAPRRNTPVADMPWTSSF